MQARWTSLVDDGGPVLRYVPDDRAGTPIADLATVVRGRRPQEAASAAARQLPGWLLATEDNHLTGALVLAGAIIKRHAVLMHCDLRQPAAPVPVDPRFTFTDFPADQRSPLWTTILPSWRAAFPPEHPDHFPGDDATAIDFIMRLTDGSELGPMHRSSALLTDAEGRSVAGIMVNIRPHEPPWGGAWIADLWRDPQVHASGVGHLLITHAKHLLADDGYVRLALAVTAGNPAQRTYQAEGFTVLTEAQTVLLRNGA